MSEHSENILDFLSNAAPLMEQLDELSQETIVELYNTFGMAIKLATAAINEIDPELRVKVCDGQDKVLERIIDLTPPVKTNKPTNIYTPAIQGYRRWQNVELMKDKGLTGYMLGKEIDAHSVMFFGTKPADYPYLSVLPEMEVLYSDAETGKIDAYTEYLLANHSKMDTLILHGLYYEASVYLNEYRKLRQDGKVYCGLDMNSYWMNNTPWDDILVTRFAEQCNVIATSCRHIRDTLNRNPKVNFPCHWIPNSFLKPKDIQINADPSIKENIILTVGRIGTEQKNNIELLIAFAGVSEVLTDWKVRFVGSIEPDFQPVIDSYFSKYPELVNRVTFTGAILDKGELYKEYAKAKIFALTSTGEGGTPNVYAEALFHGCMFVTSDIDAADDITNFGELGIKYKLGYSKDLALALLQLCSNADKKLKEHIPKALNYANKHYDWNRNAKKLAYMLYGA